MSRPSKIIVILGPTASGKTKLAVRLALKFNGEIVSADSRQVYRGMDVGTGKDLSDFRFKILDFRFKNKKQKEQNNCQSSIVNRQLSIVKIPYHLIDVANPKRRFNLAKYQKMAFKAIDDILKRGKLPILVGGSGLYLQAVVDNFKLSGVKKDLVLRKKLEKLTVEQLFAKIKKLSLKIATEINNSDRKNKRRLIRYLEILFKSRSRASNSQKLGFSAREKKYKTLIIGLSCSQQELKKRIYKRIISRLEKEKMINEVKRLHRQGLSWKKLEDFGLEYKFISLYLQNKLAYDEMVEKLNIATNQFANRQMSWFRRWERQGARINWVEDNKKSEKLIKTFLQ